jgi:serine/threonine-protein kinase
VRVLGRYALYDEIASGGMATIHFGRLIGVVGFAKTVAIKRLHPQLARDPEFVSMFLDEARLAARVRHPNVVSTLDVVAIEGELFLVMEYVQGESLKNLERRAAEQESLIPPPVVATIVVGMLYGLHAAHEATSERGEPLGIVHRDVSPQNVLIGVDGVPRVFDFGVAKATGRAQTTREGQLKGKLAYMSPEQMMGRNVARSSDIFAASTVLWEALTGKRLFKGDSEGEIVKKVLDAEVEAPSKLVAGLPAQLDELVLRGLARNPGDRFATAREMGRALEKCMPLAPTSEVGEYVEAMAATTLAQRAARMAEIESSSTSRPSRSGLPAAPTSSTSSIVAMPGEFSSSRSTVNERLESLAPTSPSRPNPVARASSPGDARAPLSGRASVLRRVVVAGLAVAGALLFAAIGAALRSQPETKAAAAVPAPVAAPPPLEKAAPSAVEIPTLAPPPPVESVAASPPSAEPHPAPVAPTKAMASPAPRPVHRRPATSCDPPFVVDANGYRHYKLECAE